MHHGKEEQQRLQEEFTSTIQGTVPLEGSRAPPGHAFCHLGGSCAVPEPYRRPQRPEPMIRTKIATLLVVPGTGTSYCTHPTCNRTQTHQGSSLITTSKYCSTGATSTPEQSLQLLQHRLDTASYIQQGLKDCTPPCGKHTVMERGSCGSACDGVMRRTRTGSAW